MSSTRRGRSALPALCLSAGLAGLSVGVIRPILVGIADSYGITVALAGQLMTGAALAGLVGNLIIAPLVDRFCRRTAIVSALTVISVGSLSCAVAPTFVTLMLAYATVGLGGITLLALVISSVGDLHEGARRARALGWVLAGNVGVGLIVLPALSALADPLGWPVVFAGTAGLAAATAIFARLVLPANLSSQPTERLGYVATLAHIARNRVTVALLLAIAAYHVSIYGFSTYAGAIPVDRFAATSAQAGLVLSARALGMTAAGALAGRSMRSADWRLATAATIASAALGLFGYTSMRKLWVYAGMLLLHGAAVGIADIAIVSMLLNSEPARRGSVTALRSVMEGVGGILGPASGGAVIAARGPLVSGNPLGADGYSAAGWLFAAVALVAAGIIIVAGQRQARQSAGQSYPTPEAPRVAPGQGA